MRRSTGAPEPACTCNAFFLMYPYAARSTVLPDTLTGLPSFPYVPSRQHVHSLLHVGSAFHGELAASEPAAVACSAE